MRIYTVRLHASLTGDGDTAELSEQVLARLADQGLYPDLAGPDDDGDYTFWLTLTADTPEDSVARAGWGLRTAAVEASVAAGHHAEIEILAVEAQQLDVDSGAEHALTLA